MEKRIVQNILNYCRENQMTIMAFEQKCKIANGSVGKWETGKCKPSFRSIAKIVEATHIPLEEWVKGENT